MHRNRDAASAPQRFRAQSATAVGWRSKQFANQSPPRCRLEEELVIPNDRPPENILRATEIMVHDRLGPDATGHDWFHTDRVRRVALRIAQDEAANGATLDPTVIELAALLHDVDDWKFAGGDETAAPRAAAAWLANQGADPTTVSHVAEIIGALSFKGAGVPTPMRTPEGAIVQDADRLDALGAIGIARTFAYGGHTGAVLHDPDVPPSHHDSFAAYKSGGGTTINHFPEKLLLLRDRMNTTTARGLAAGRHTVMERFLARFFAEWEGDA